MKAPLPRTLSAVPQTLHTQIEIANAIRTLAGPDQDELLRQRRAEIAAIRRELEALPGEIRKAGEECLALAKAELQAALKKYSPDQPRVSAGNRDGGQWTSGSKAGGEAPGAPLRYASLENPVGGARPDVAASGGITVNTDAADTQNVVGNLYNVLHYCAPLWTENRQNLGGSNSVDHPRYPSNLMTARASRLSFRAISSSLANLPPERYMGQLAMHDFSCCLQTG